MRNAMIELAVWPFALYSFAFLPYAVEQLQFGANNEFGNAQFFSNGTPYAQLIYFS